MEALLEKLTTGVLNAEEIRIVRAIESLDKMNHADARALLQTLAQGAPGALTTRHAQWSLDRMTKYQKCAVVFAPKVLNLKAQGRAAYPG
jgi:hypothetical protein